MYSSESSDQVATNFDRKRRSSNTSTSETYLLKRHRLSFGQGQPNNNEAFDYASDSCPSDDDDILYNNVAASGTDGNKSAEVEAERQLMQELNLHPSFASNTLQYWGIPAEIAQAYFAYNGVSSLYPWQEDCLGIHSVLRGGWYFSPFNFVRPLFVSLFLAIHCVSFSFCRSFCPTQAISYIPHPPVVARPSWRRFS